MRFIFIVLLISPISFACPSNSQPSIKQQWLDAHNKARADVGVRPLEWSDVVEKSAKRWAKQMGKLCRMYHERNSGYGENLWMGWGYGGKEIPIANSVRAWVNEKKYYDPKNPKWCTGGECMHYTQVVWSNSRFLGCAEVKCMKGNKPARIRVCRYDPPGNFRGRKPF